MAYVSFKRTQGFTPKWLLLFLPFLSIPILTGCGGSSAFDQANIAIASGEAAAITGVTETVTSGSNSLTTEEQSVLDQINALRASRGLNPVQFDLHAEAAAIAHSDYMFANSTLTHSEPSPNASSWDRMQSQGGNFNATGEIIACGNAGASATFQQWYNSSGHLAIMIGSQYQYIGIHRSGTATGSCPYYWTADFGGK